MKTRLLALGLTLLASVLYAAQPATVITSDTMEMESLETENHFYFYGNVEIIGNNLSTTCKQMRVVTLKSQPGGDVSDSDDIGNIAFILAEGEVTIIQGERKATADKAEIFPQKQRAELSGNVVVEDAQGILKGPRVILEKGRRAYVPSENGERPTVILPGFGDFSEEVANPEEAAEEAKEDDADE